MKCMSFLTNSRGSILFLTLMLTGVLSVLLLFATDSFILASKARSAFEDAIGLFYIAEAGLSHGHAYCQTKGCEAAFSLEVGTENAEARAFDLNLPFYRWIPYGKGRYYIEVFQLNETYLHPLLDRDSGVLIIVTACLYGIDSRKQLCLLIEEPPDWKTIAWWEPE